MIRAFLLAGAVLALPGVAFAQTTGVARNGTLPGPLPLFPPDNWWNADISRAPVDARSPAFINWIQTTGRRRLHPDFGGDSGLAQPLIYGMPYVVVPGTQPLVPVAFFYGDESDAGAPGRPPGYPIPEQAKTEVRWIEGGMPGGGTDGDRHMLIIDRDNRLLYELFALQWNTSSNRWEAGSGAVFSLSSNARRPEGWTSADAAGLAILPGLIRYDEVFGPDPIRHALRFTVRATNGYVYPASHRAGSNPSAPPMGARFRLKALKDISSFPPHIRKIFQAMKTYGLIVADNGSDMFIQGTYDVRWNMDEMHAAFRTVFADDFEIVELGWRPSMVTQDNDADGLPDDWERQFGLDPANPSGSDGPDGDPDADGRLNRVEWQTSTHPRGVHTRYLAEGTTGAFFDMRLSIFNPGIGPAIVQIRFRAPDGTTTPQTVTIPGPGHVTVDPETLPALASSEFATVVESDRVVVVDRAMSWDSRGYGSHVERATEAPALTWHFAEGATHSGFNLFYLLQNPSDVAANVEISYLRPAPAAPVVKAYGVPPGGRLTVWANQQDAALASADVSATVRSVNSVPIIAERAMYLDAGGDTFGAGHASAGVTAPATSWFLAEGATGSYFDLFVLIANPGSTAAAVSATYLLPDGSTVVKTYVVAPLSRATVWVDREDARLAETAVSIALSSSQPVVVERAMWWPGPTAGSWREAHGSMGSTTAALRWGIAGGEVGGTHRIETYVLVANTTGVATSVRAMVGFEDGSSAEKIFLVRATSRLTIDVGAEFPVAAGRRFGMLLESLASPVVVERAVYSSPGGTVWAAGGAALATSLP